MQQNVTLKSPPQRLQLKFLSFAPMLAWALDILGEWQDHKGHRMLTASQLSLQAPEVLKCGRPNVA